jgi:zona occludens toxin (predicted ATPase)
MERITKPTKIPIKIINTIIPAQHLKNNRKIIAKIKLHTTEAKMTYLATTISEIQLINLSLLKKEKLINFSEAIFESSFNAKASILT